MKVFLVLLVSTFADLIGYNRQMGISQYSQKRSLNVQFGHQDQIIRHLAKNGDYMLLREFLQTVRENNKPKTKRNHFRRHHRKSFN